MKPRFARISQYFFLALFLVLFIQTDYRGSDQINKAVNAFFRSDPLVLLSYLLAQKAWTWFLFPGLLMVIATLFLGRFFCGWICPLGTILDLYPSGTRKAKTAPSSTGKLKHWLLLTLLASSLFNLNLAGLLDPIAILLRGLTFAIYPLLGLATRETWVRLYELMGERRDTLAPAYALLRDYLLPFRQTMYPLAMLSALLLVAILALEYLQSRYWCRNLCPLGTLLGWLSRFRFYKRIPASLCSDCGACNTFCPAVSCEKIPPPEECFVCMECRTSCPHQRVSFCPDIPSFRQKPFLPERRLVLGGLATGLLLSIPTRFRYPDQSSRLLRPPGVRDESEFLKSCVRCGECIKVCLKSALYPATWQAGIEGIATPLLIPRLGYCEYNCTLCGQVCPTGAIPVLQVETKRRETIGKAVFDKNHCLPFARQTDCIVCEEHCPIPDKAIRSHPREVIGPNGARREVREPFVVDEICTGCGICEYVCPLDARPGIEVFAVKNRTPITLKNIPPFNSDDSTGPQANARKYGNARTQKEILNSLTLSE